LLSEADATDEARRSRRAVEHVNMILEEDFMFDEI